MDVDDHCNRVEEFGIGIANIISSLFAFLGNGLVIGLTFPCWCSISKFRRLIGALALNDFLFAMVQLILNIPKIWTCNWIYGHFMCKLFTAFLSASEYATIGFIVIIAFDRYIGVIHPFNVRFLSERMVVLASCLNIFVAVLSTIPQFIFLQVWDTKQCGENWRKGRGKVYTWFLFSFYYIAPNILISAMYIKMIIWLKRKLVNLQALNNEQLKRRTKKRQRVTMMLILILAAFAILALPKRIIFIVGDYYDLDEMKEAGSVSCLIITSSICYGFHVVINPIIYSFVDSKFKGQLKRLYKRLKRSSDHSIERAETISVCFTLHGNS